MKRSYYSESIENFLNSDVNSILGEIARNNQFDLIDTQRNTWISEIQFLKLALQNISGRILFEYTIPRIGKRVDVVVLTGGIVYLLEFKCGDGVYQNYAVDQVLDYALDLKCFQKESHNAIIVPILVATNARSYPNKFENYGDGIIKPLRLNAEDLVAKFAEITAICSAIDGERINEQTWENSIYYPTPTIIEAAQALYSNHNVEDISRSDAGAKNLTVTTEEINKIIEYSEQNNRKSIIFVTGVPGAGKTLVGLNIASSRQNFDKEERGVFLSGNGPLVEVLTEALARDKVERAKAEGLKMSKSVALREASAIIQIIHKYRDAYVGNEDLPAERIAIFDEAQRAWTAEQLVSFMVRKKGVANFNYSEPEFLISTMDRFEGYAVIVCLIGGGQEINTGEAGLPEWFDSIRRSFPHWDIYTSKELYDEEYTRGRDIKTMLEGLNVSDSNNLHLSVSMRSFRSEKQADFVKNLLDVNNAKSAEVFSELKEKYPIVLTRDYETAKKWIKNTARGTQRYGVIASSNALRLKPFGLQVKNELSPAYWFLNDKNDIRSSNFLEDVATEFAIQGLELDYSIVAWDANLRMERGKWGYYAFRGDKWQNVSKEENKLYLKNAYRVLLTRARQGMVIFVPEGSLEDETRKPEYYNGVYEYLKEIGIEEI